VSRIISPIADFMPPLSAEKTMPEAKMDAVPGQETYEASCAVCHATDSMGAPPVGDKAAWAAVLEKGIDNVYHNTMVGINAMPPKGGAMDLTDTQIKEVVDYMLEASK
jgi:cytochrome c